MQRTSSPDSLKFSGRKLQVGTFTTKGNPLRRLLSLSETLSFLHLIVYAFN
jgi:hypothetical protein